jgi:hypothetical protein
MRNGHMRKDTKAAKTDSAIAQIAKQCILYHTHLLRRVCWHDAARHQHHHHSSNSIGQHQRASYVPRLQMLPNSHRTNQCAGQQVW